MPTSLRETFLEATTQTWSNYSPYESLPSAPARSPDIGGLQAGKRQIAGWAILSVFAGAEQRCPDGITALGRPEAISVCDHGVRRTAWHLFAGLQMGGLPV